MKSIQHLSFVCLLALLTVQVSMAQDAPSTINTENIEVIQEEPSEKPIMTFETKTVDYGTIEKGSDPIRKINFTNTGTAPLIIKHAKGSCGCTVPTVPKEPVLPGETAEIQIRYDTKRVGPIRKSVRITTNEGDAPHVLQVRGTINAPKPQEALPTNEGGLTE